MISKSDLLALRAELDALGAVAAGALTDLDALIAREFPTKNQTIRSVTALVTLNGTVVTQYNQLEEGDAVLTGIANDTSGRLLEHWLELKNPDGLWTWEGWNTSPEWTGALGGNNYTSQKRNTFKFTPGIWVFRSTCNHSDSPEMWDISNEITLSIIPKTVVTPPDDGGPGPTGDGNKVYPMDWESISKRLGPIADASVVRLKNTKPTTKKADPKIGPFDQRIALYEYGKQRAKWNNFWSTTMNGLLATKQGVIPFKLQNYAGYSGMASTAPRGDAAGYKPDPETTWQSIKGTITCTWRQTGFESNEALVGTDIGELFSFGTQTSRGSSDWKGYLQIPDFCCTAVTTCSQNELAFAIGFSPATKKGMIHVVGVQAKWLPSHTMQRMGMPNQASYSAFKLLGSLELPFALSSEDPGAVAACSNGSWNGPSQTGGTDIGQIDLSNAFTRAGLLNDSEDNGQWGSIFASKGVAIITSKKAGKAVELNFSALINSFREDYLTANEADLANVIAAEEDDAHIYPPTFKEKPKLTPVFGKTYDVPTAASVVCTPKSDRWNTDYCFKALVGGEDGFMTVIDLSSQLARYSWNVIGPGGIVARKFIGKNICHLTMFRYGDWAADPFMPVDSNGKHTPSQGYSNEVIATCRGDAAIRCVVSYKDTLNVCRELSDENLIDPTCAWMDDRSLQIIAGDGKGRGVLGFVLGGVSVPVTPDDPDQTSFYYVEENSGRDFQVSGDKFDTEDPVFAFNNANVN